MTHGEAICGSQTQDMVQLCRDSAREVHRLNVQWCMDPAWCRCALYLLKAMEDRAVMPFGHSSSTAAAPHSQQDHMFHLHETFPPFSTVLFSRMLYILKGQRFATSFSEDCTTVIDGFRPNQGVLEYGRFTTAKCRSTQQVLSLMACVAPKDGNK